MKKTLLLLLFFAKIAISQTPIGTVNIEGKEVEFFYKIKASTPVIIPVPDPVVITPQPNQSTNYLVDEYRYDLIRGFVMHFKINGKTPELISWDGATYWPFAIATQDANKTGTYWLKQNGNITKIEVKTGDFNSKPYILGSNTSIPDTIPSPIVIDNNNQSDGEFDPNGSPVEMLNVGETYEVPIDRNVIQMSSFSMGKGGLQGMQTYLKQYGKLICYLYNNDGELKNGGYFNNNHPAMAQIVIKTGLLEVGYKNATNKDYPIVFGLGQIRNNMGYTFYYPNGLSSAFFYKQLNKNDHTVKRFTAEIGDEYGWIQERENGSLQKDLNINFFKSGKLYLEEMLWSSDGFSNSYDFNGTVSIRANSSDSRCIRPKTDTSCEICVKIVTKGYGQTGSIQVVSEKGDLKVSKDMVRISGYVYNLVNYARAEGIKNKDYKMYNNAGYVDELTKSIVQKDF